MKNTCKLCWIILSLFLLGNVILLGVWWFGKETQNRQEVRRFNKEEHRREMRDQFMRNTNINDAQFDQMYMLWKDHSKRMYKSKMEVDSLRQLLMNETFSDNTDTLVVQQLMDQVSAKQRKIEAFNYNHFRKLRDVCETDEQRQMLDKLLRSRIMDDGHRKKRFRGRRKRH